MTRQSHNQIKKNLQTLSDRSWWITKVKEVEKTVKINNIKQTKVVKTEEEVLVRWFEDLNISKDSGIVKVRFHKKIKPFLIDLINQKQHYTSYELKYVLPMASKHSPRLYEILKSYQRNNNSWFFEIDKLKYLMDCENYKRWPDFRRFALDPAVEEINKYTDIVVAYDVKRVGKKVTRIIFRLDEKTFSEKIDTESEIQLALNGQLDLFAAIEDVRNSPNGNEFIKQRIAAHRAELKKD